MIAAMIGMGANLGDPIQQIVDARDSLLALESSVSGRCSSLYLSSPVGYSDQPNFVNCVFELQTNAPAQTLLQALQTIETALGRRRMLSNQNAPRVIDLDLLLYGDQSIDTEQLIVPHPRLHERLFVLAPLCELQPELWLDGRGRVAHVINQISSSTDQVLNRLCL